MRTAKAYGETSPSRTQARAAGKEQRAPRAAAASLHSLLTPLCELTTP